MFRISLLSLTRENDYDYIDFGRDSRNSSTSGFSSSSSSSSSSSTFTLRSDCSYYGSCQALPGLEFKSRISPCKRNNRSVRRRTKSRLRKRRRIRDESPTRDNGYVMQFGSDPNSDLYSSEEDEPLAHVDAGVRFQGGIENVSGIRGQQHQQTNGRRRLPIPLSTPRTSTPVPSAPPVPSSYTSITDQEKEYINWYVDNVERLPATGYTRAWSACFVPGGPTNDLIHLVPKLTDPINRGDPPLAFRPFSGTMSRSSKSTKSNPNKTNVKQLENQLLNMDDDRASNANLSPPRRSAVNTHRTETPNNSIYPANAPPTPGGSSTNSATSYLYTRQQCKALRGGTPCEIHNPFHKHRRTGVRRRRNDGGPPSSYAGSVNGEDIDEGLFSEENEDFLHPSCGHHHHNHQHDHTITQRSSRSHRQIDQQSENEGGEDVTIIRRKIFVINRYINNRRRRLQERVVQAIDQYVPGPVKTAASSVWNLLLLWLWLLLMMLSLAGSIYYLDLILPISMTKIVDYYFWTTSSVGSWITSCFCRSQGDALLGTPTKYLDEYNIQRIDRLEKTFEEFKSSFNPTALYTRQEVQDLLRIEVESFKSTIESLRSKTSDTDATIDRLRDDLSSHISSIDSNVSSTTSENQRLKDLVTTFLARLEMIDKRTSWQESGDSLSSNADIDLIKQLIKEAIEIYDADKTGIPDFALEAGGASIVSAHCSETYAPKNMQYKFLGIPILSTSNSPRVVIQPGNLPGNCWAFKGHEGQLTIKLAHRVIPTAISYEHAPKRLSFTREGFDSAPRKIEVIGYETESPSNEEGFVLGTYEYLKDDPDLQQFIVSLETARSITHVSVKVLTNWGNPDYTCLYRIRVHGMIPPSTN